MIVLDTNVVSELMRPAPAEAVVAWVDAQPPVELFLTSVTIAELLYGVGRLAEGARKVELAGMIEAMLVEDFDDRIIGFDSAAAAHYADVVVRRERAGRPISMADALVAATCRSHGAILATRNVDDFDETGLTIANPWDGS